MILQIFNKISGHYEIIESIINKYFVIIGTKNITKIYLKVHEWDKSFKQYILKKYPEIEFKLTKKFDFQINCSIYPKHFDMISKLDNKKFFFIAHDIENKLKVMENVFYLTPLAKRFLYADIMPHMTKKELNTNIPIYVIQGHFGGKHARRRNLNLLLNIFKHNYEKKFKIKFIGTGEIPEEFKPHLDKIEFVQNLNFVDYHKEFLDCYAMFTLTLKSTNKQYYKTKLTSSINYIRGYKLKAIIDQDLQDIYNLKDVETYTTEENVVDAFKRSLNDFYAKYIQGKKKNPEIKNENSKNITENNIKDDNSENNTINENNPKNDIKKINIKITNNESK